MEASCSKVSQLSYEGGPSAEVHFEASNVIAGSAATSKRGRHGANDGCLWSKLDTDLWSMLDDDLVEKIIARLPFKSLFQATSLSKTWSSKFLAHSFQNEVHESTASWKSYSPLFINNYMEMIGYDSVSKVWHKLPTLSYLPVESVDWNLRAGGGSLLCWTSADQKMLEDPYKYNLCDGEYQVYVSNPLTRRWKQLPERPVMRFPDVVHVVCNGSKAYQVILVSEIGRRGYPNCALCVQIFDSASCSWTVKHLNTGMFLDVAWGCSAYINGVLYLLGRRDGYSLTSFNVEDETWKHIPHLCQGMDGSSAVNEGPNPHLRFHDLRFSQVVVCGSEVMLVVLHKDKLSVFRLDLTAGLAFEVSRAPSEMLWAVHLCAAAGQGDCIYIGRRCPSFRSILYNVKAQEWQWVPFVTGRAKSAVDSRYDYWLWTSITYQPGVNPFVEV
ncbi:unnamed protein product [Calypogeia fissa]